MSRSIFGRSKEKPAEAGLKSRFLLLDSGSDVGDCHFVRGTYT